MEKKSTNTSTQATSNDLTAEQKEAEQKAEQERQEYERRVRERKAYERKQHIEMLMQAIDSTRVYRREEQDFSDKQIYDLHANLIIACANEILAPVGRKFEIDDDNRDVIRFLLYYFNGSPLALDVFKDRKYSLYKNILLIGKAGVGKTFLLEVFRQYLDKTHNPRGFRSISQTQLLDYYKQHNQIDYYTYNTQDSRSFEGRPFSLCLNDIGLRTQKFYGQDTEMVVEEFLYARHEIWEQVGKALHITSNLNRDELTKLFEDEHNRLKDRLKMFNVIPLGGNSRR